jgi:hypothetical protein
MLKVESWICRCQLVSTEEGNVPVCKGDATLGEECYDRSYCSVDDQCVEGGGTNPFDLPAFCKGVLATDYICNDYNECTYDDKCVEISYGEGFFGFTCRGTFADGQACDDNFNCTIDDTCQEVEGYEEPLCLGKLSTGGPCNDYDQCTDNDTCVLSTNGGPLCLGTANPTCGQ